MIARNLTSLVVVLAALAVAPAARAQTLTPDEVVLRNYALTMPKVNAWATASVDFANAVKAMPASERAKRKAEMEAQVQETETLAGMAASLERVPEIRRAYRKVGLTTREGVTLSLVLMQAVMFDEIAATNPDAKVPYNMNPANVAFIRKNKAEVTARMKEVQEANKSVSDEKSSDEPSSGDPSSDEP